jgi:hypothetical protein
VRTVGFTHSAIFDSGVLLYPFPHGGQRCLTTVLVFAQLLLGHGLELFRECAHVFVGFGYPFAVGHGNKDRSLLI